LALRHPELVSLTKESLVKERNRFIESENDAYVRAVHDKGLAFDLNTMSRRHMLVAAGSAGALALLGRHVLFGSDPAAAAACLEEIESETAGPYPADGSNGIEVRTLDGIVRTDIRPSFGTSTTVAQGVPLTISLTVQDLSCAPLAGAAVYVWHCDREGNYSLYSSAVTDENYLRGIGVTDSTGLVEFTSIYPACYTGRWPHIHFEVYSSLAEATSGSGPIRKTSQIALTEAGADEVYATAGYEQSVTNISRITLASDMVFGDDNAAREMATMTGNVSSGYTAALTATVDPTNTETGGGTPPGGGPRPTPTQ
jgi:protocatechuate 3,4-dioxygenase beta subunit